MIVGVFVGVVVVGGGGGCGSGVVEDINGVSVCLM